MEEKEPEIRLPQTELELDEFVQSIIDEFKLPSGDDTYDAIATMIMHLPQTKAYVPRSYFGHGVYKAMANRAAYYRLMEIKKRRDAKEKVEKEQNEAAAKKILELVPTSDQSIQNPEIQS